MNYRFTVHFSTLFSTISYPFLRNAGLGEDFRRKEMEHPFESLAKKESKSDAELIAFLAVTRISHQLPIGAVLSLPASQLAPEQVYDSLLREAYTFLEWYQEHVERRSRTRSILKGLTEQPSRPEFIGTRNKLH